MSAWKAAKTPDGRTYYYKQGSTDTTWDKPEGFDDTAPTATPAAPAWSEAKTAEGRVYYWNTVTKETSWDVPEGYVNQQQIARTAASFVAGGAQNFGSDDREVSDRRIERRQDRDHALPQKPSFDGGRGGGMPWEQRQDNTGFRGPMPVKTDEPEYATFEQAEEAFFKLLRQHKISPDAQWEVALREVIKEREYKAIKDPRDRRTAFYKYCAEARAQEKGKEKERRAKLREDFLKMLATHDEIKHYTRWKTARPIIEREMVFKSAGNDDERRQLFDEYLLGLKKKHAKDEIEQHRKGLQELHKMSQTLVSDPDTKWHDAKQAVLNNERYNTDEAFTTITNLDVINLFDTHVKALERMRIERGHQEKHMQFRRERQARDQFRQLLKELRSQGKIHAKSKWSDVLTTFVDDERYLNAVGNNGSSPLDLFLDALEEEEVILRELRNDALDVLNDERYEMTMATSRDEFAQVMASDQRTRNLSSIQLPQVYDGLMEKIKRRVDKDKESNQRSQRKAIDALRSVIKRLEPPIRSSDVYEDIAPRLQSYEEFQALDDDGRKTAFDKHIRRQKEKDEERERDRSRRDRDRERNGSRRDHDRERDRRLRTRSPEADAYEADRRRAQADRERQYRKASFGLTPPPRDRRDDRDDRYRRHDRHESMYDRERREREMERERNYVSRADPRDRERALDYGDEEAVGSRPGSVRKRRESESTVGAKRDAKRPRRNGRTPEPEAMEQDDAPALQSGSEEGEIEEV